MIITLGIRVVQLLCAAVVLALSAYLVNTFGPDGHAPSLISYGVFCGGGALVFAVVGIVAIFFEPLQGIMILVADAIASFFLLAGAAAFVAKVKTGDCTNLEYIATIWNAVIRVSGDKVYENVGAAQADSTFRCRMSRADTAFVWILFICFVGTIILSFMSKPGRGAGSIV